MKLKKITNDELFNISGGMGLVGWFWHTYAEGEGIKERSRLHRGGYVN